MLAATASVGCLLVSEDHHPSWNLFAEEPRMLVAIGGEDAEMMYLKESTFKNSLEVVLPAFPRHRRRRYCMFDRQARADSSSTKFKTLHLRHDLRAPRGPQAARKYSLIRLGSSLRFDSTFTETTRCRLRNKPKLYESRIIVPWQSWDQGGPAQLDATWS